MPTPRIISAPILVTVVVTALLLPLTAPATTAQPTAQQGVSAPATSSARAGHSCNLDDAEHLRVKRWVTLDSHSYAITHADRVRLARGTSYSRATSPASSSARTAATGAVVSRTPRPLPAVADTRYW